MKITKEDLIIAKKLFVDANKVLKSWYTEFIEIMEKPYLEDDSTRYKVTLHLLSSFICHIQQSFYEKEKASKSDEGMDFSLMIAHILMAHQEMGGCSNCHICDECEEEEEEEEEDDNENEESISKYRSLIKMLDTLIEVRKKRKK